MGNVGDVSAIRAGLSCRCPACGEGALFEGFLTVRDHCDRCGQDFRAQDSGDGPVAFIIMIVGFVIVGTGLIVEVNYGWPLWLHLLVWLPLTVVGVLGLMRPSKSLLIALQYKHRRNTLTNE